MTAEAFLNGYEVATEEALGETDVKMPLGIRIASSYAGIRKPEKDDLALIVPDQPALLPPFSPATGCKPRRCASRAGI